MMFSVSIGAGKVTAKTKYEEDVYTNNHNAVWGSYFSRQARKWGFSCCHSCIRNSYCTGVVGREANDNLNTVRQLQIEVFF